MLAGLLILLCSQAYAGTGEVAARGPYLQELQARAAKLELAQTRAWHALLHYEKNWLRPGLHSTVASDWFFRAETGRSNPQAELNATLEAFIQPGNMAPRDTPAQCVYRARYAFLNHHLDFDGQRMPVAECPKYERWIEGLNPKSISLIFPSAYLNSPASMFGHTLLRIDSEKQTRSTELLAYAVNFAANTQEEQTGFKFAYKGMTGGYPGIYGVFPYYEKVKQYAWIESRDVWAYELKLSEAELQQLLAHLWEMQGVSFDYYFLTKNCSYQLLSLIQAARPELRLVEEFNWYAIPADTIRALRRVPGLLGPAQFRPALGTTLAHQAQQLTESQRELALATGSGKLSPTATELQSLAPRARARVLEVAHDYNYYRSQSAEPRSDVEQRSADAENRRDEAVAAQAGDRPGPRATNSAVARSRAILLARSKIPTRAEFAPPAAPSVPPDAGHTTLRASAGGVIEDGRFSVALRIRPAYHDVLDPPGGYTDGAQINFLDLGLRLDPGAGELRIEDLTFIDILSLSPRGDLFKPISWRVGTGLRRRPSSEVFGDEPNNLSYFLQGGPGLAWGSLDSIAAYGFALASVDANTSFDPDYAVAIGGSAGILARPTANWQLRAEVGGLSYQAGGEGQRRWAFVEQQVPLWGRWALRMRVEIEDAANENTARGQLTLHGYYF